MLQKLAILALSISAASAQIISTVAGLAEQRGHAGDNGPAPGSTLALANLQNDCDPVQFEQTSHISVDAAGNLYIADANNHRIRKVAPSGVITTVAGTGQPPQSNARCEPTGTVNDGELATKALLYNPADVVVLADGSLVIADELNNRVRQILPSGVATTIVGGGGHNPFVPGFVANRSSMDWPSAVAVDAAGLVYFAEMHGNRVGRVNADGRLANLAGNGFPGYTGDNIPATNAQLKRPAGIAIDRAGAIYIADTGNHRIRKVTSDGVIRTIAGNGQAAFSGDGGRADSAALNGPMDVKVDSQGNVYIADTGNHRVRRVDANGIIQTVAGTGVAGRGSDNVDPLTSALNFPSALALDRSDDLYIVDWQNYLVRKVTFSAAPVLSVGGAVNTASFTSAIAPGGLVSLFGANLATTTAAAPNSPWASSLGGISAQINGAAVPLYFVSRDQLIVQIPYESLVGPAVATVQLEDRRSNPVRLRIDAVAPAIFTSGPRAAALNQDGVTVNGPSSPESRGSIVTIFVTGLGAMNPPVTTGVAAGSSALSRPTADVTATVGGVSADIQFVGLTPGLIGVGQVNLQIPQAVTPGADVPVIVSSGVQSSNVATIAVR